MIKTRPKISRFTAIVAVVAAISLSAASARAELLFGLTTTNSLISFDSATPGTISAPIAITGIGAETIFDIDIRPATQALYGLGSAGNLYIINRTTGVATLASSLNVSLDSTATRFGIDFNPVPDRLRIVSSTGQNLRVDVSNGATTVDGALNGADTRAVSVAYSNNDNDPATGTSLFYIDSDGTDNTYTTSNPNGGTLTLVGALGVNTNDNVGFDISGFTGVAYATLTSPTGTGSGLYSISLATGAATFIGAIGNGAVTLRGVAALTTPDTASTMLLLGLACAGLLVAHRRFAVRGA